MNTADKDFWLYSIALRYCNEYNYDVASPTIQNFFTLEEDALYFLDCLAAITGIKPDGHGRSRARVLWIRVQRGRNQLPF